MKVLLMSVYITPENDPSEYEYNLPPLGLAQIASVLREEGHEVEILDCVGLYLTRKRALQEIRKNKPDIIGVGCNPTRACSNAMQAAREIREIYPDVPLVTGGIHSTFEYEGMLDAFDFVVRGEGELTFLELLNTLENDGKLEDVDGLCYKKNGEMKVNRARAFIKDLDSLPPPARDLLPNYTYEFFGLDKNVTAIECSRGCPFNCNFCSTSTMWGAVRRCKSAEKVLDELRLTYEQGFRGYYFVDGSFTLTGDIERAKKICEGILKEKMDISWTSHLRPDTIAKNQDFIELASRSGMKMAVLGYESASRKVLDDIGKRADPSVYGKAYSTLRKNRVITSGSFIFGSTERETLEDMDRTIELSKKICDVAYYMLLVPRPGSRAYMEADKNGKLLTKDWDKYVGGQWLLKGGLGAKALEKKQLDAYSKFYLRPKKLQDMFFSRRSSWEKMTCRGILKAHIKKEIYTHLTSKITPWKKRIYRILIKEMISSKA